jgi:hypothetical protein
MLPHPPRPNSLIPSHGPFPQSPQVALDTFAGHSKFDNARITICSLVSHPTATDQPLQRQAHAAKWVMGRGTVVAGSELDRSPALLLRVPAAVAPRGQIAYVAVNSACASSGGVYHMARCVEAHVEHLGCAEPGSC